MKTKLTDTFVKEFDSREKFTTCTSKFSAGRILGIIAACSTCGVKTSRKANKVLAELLRWNLNTQFRKLRPNDQNDVLTVLQSSKVNVTRQKDGTFK